MKFIGESTMTQYDDLKERISNVTGWDKEADDILQEIGGDYYICIKARNSESTFVRSVEIQSNVGDRVLVGRPLRYRNQCEKLSAFKQALLWLLDKSEAEKAKEGDRAEVEVDGQRFEAKLIKKL